MACFLGGLDLALFPIGRAMALQLAEEEQNSGKVMWHSYGWIYLFSFLVGFSTTIAEPALIAVANKAEEASRKAVSSWGLRFAVAIGVAIDTVYSSLELGLSKKIAQQVLECLGNLGFHLCDPSLSNLEILFDGLEEFRQHLGGRLTLTMLKDVGDPFEIHSVNRDKMLAAIEQVAHFADTREAFQSGN